MGIKERLRFNIFRQRNALITSKQQTTMFLKKIGIFFALFITSLAALISIVLVYKSYGPFKVLKADNTQKTDQSSIKEIDVVANKEEVKDTNNLENVITDSSSVPVINNVDDEFNITLIGDIMMGGTAFQDPSSSYMLAFKNVVEYTKKADYTVCNLTTNISNLEEIEDPISKYVVKKDIINAFNALGVDGVNVANDHALDFGEKQFNTTIKILKDNKLSVIGLSKDIVYAESSGIRVAFVAINNVAIGSVYSYTSAGINMYDRVKTKALIDEARKNADTIIVMPHYGKENTYVVSDNMRFVAKDLVDMGADMVVGSHALGIYPVEEYKGKQIIYSEGYFMSDTYYEVGKQSAIFNIAVNKKGEITKTEIIPVYIESGKEVKLYSDVDKKDSDDYLKRLFVENTFEKYGIKKENNKLVISLK